MITKKKKTVNLYKLGFHMAIVALFVQHMVFTSIPMNKEEIRPFLDEKPVLLKEVEAEEKPVEIIEEKPQLGQRFEGRVSYYSHDGCLGCSENQITASGEPFDENAMTLAFNKLPMKTMVRVTNLDNGKTIIAKVNDTGGFESLGRIADLSMGLAIALDAKTDKSSIVIEELL